MIHLESWYKEALDRAEQLKKDPYRDRGIHEEYLRNRKLLERDQNPDQGTLIEDAIRSWRMGRTSELENRALEDPDLFGLVMDTAKKAGHIPYLTEPSVFCNELPDDLQRLILDEAAQRVPGDRAVLRWFFQIASDSGNHLEFQRPYVKDDLADKLALGAISLASQEPQLLKALINTGDWPYSLENALSPHVREKVWEATTLLAEETKDPELLSMLWGNDYDYPDLSWEAVFATPEDSLPDVGYVLVYYDLDPGSIMWDSSTGDEGYVNLKEFAKIYNIWDGFHWDKEIGRGWFLTTGEHYERIGPEEIKEITERRSQDNSEDEEDTLFSEDPHLEELEHGSQASIYFDGNASVRSNGRGDPSTREGLVTWLKEHWPPPNTTQEEKQ